MPTPPSALSTQHSALFFPATEIVVATGNAGKVREFAEMLEGGSIRCLPLSVFPGTTAVPETGSTFRANACQKAAGYAVQLGKWALADDSGLEVDVLDGRPGVHSARWAEMHQAGKGDFDNNQLLLQQLRDVPEERRGARFVCVLALADPAGRIVMTARDTVEGKILTAPVGTNGFGYDPLFRIPALGRTTAQLHPAEKHEISHRGKALLRLRRMLARVAVD